MLVSSSLISFMQIYSSAKSYFLSRVTRQEILFLLFWKIIQIQQFVSICIKHLESKFEIEIWIIFAVRRCEAKWNLDNTIIKFNFQIENTLYMLYFYFTQLNSFFVVMGAKYIFTSLCQKYFQSIHKGCHRKIWIFNLHPCPGYKMVSLASKTRETLVAYILYGRCCCIN